MPGGVRLTAGKLAWSLLAVILARRREPAIDAVDGSPLDCGKIPGMNSKESCDGRSPYDWLNIAKSVFHVHG